MQNEHERSAPEYMEGNSVNVQEAAGATFLFFLALILLFALLRCQRRNRRLLEEKIEALEG